MGAQNKYIFGKLRHSFRSWGSPNFAVTGNQSVHVRDLEQDTLDTLASTWLAELYNKAGKPTPFVYAPQTTARGEGS